MNIKEIAKKAGFSESTVSRALNDDPRISQKTTAIIQKIAAESNYTKDFAALNMNKSESNILAVVFPPDNLLKINNPFYTEIVKQAAYTASQHRYLLSVVMAPTMAQLNREIEQLIVSGKVRKFIVLFNFKTSPVLRQLKHADVRFVVIGKPNDTAVPFVDNDNYAAGQAVMQQALATKAIHQPLFIGSNHEWRFEQDRYQGAQFECQQQQIELAKFEFAGADFTTLLPQFKQQLTQADLLIFSSDELLIKLYGYLNEQPQLPIISFNNSDDIKPLSRKIQSVDLNPQLMGQRAAELVFSPTIKENANWIAFQVM